MTRPKYDYEFHVMTHAEIGKVLGLTGERVRQIEKEAMAKLRSALGAEGETHADLKRTEHEVMLKKQAAKARYYQLKKAERTKNKE